MEKIRLQMQQLRPEVPISAVELPKGHSLNDVWVNYGTDGILKLFKEGKTQSNGKALKIHNGYKISFEGATGTFFEVGNLPMDLGNLRVSLQIVANSTQKKHRLKVDLFDFGSVQHQCTELSEKQGFDYEQLETDFSNLTDLLEQHREALFEAEINPVTDIIPKRN